MQNVMIALAAGLAANAAKAIMPKTIVGRVFIVQEQSEQFIIMKLV